MSLVLIIIAITYLLCLGWLSIGMDKIDYFKSTNDTAQTPFSIVIPFKDEAEYLPGLLKSIDKLNYPSALFEVIFIDDASSDGSRDIVIAFAEGSPLNITILANIRQTSSPKKDAIKIAIKAAKHPWVISTDADVIVPMNWLSTFDQFIQSRPCKLIVAPVVYTNENGWLGQFQALDQLSLQASTLGGFGIDHPFLCSGANLCYEKKAFSKLNPFEKNSHIASGDDIFLLHSFKKHFPKEVHFLKSRTALVTTYPEKSWAGLVQQRLRWAAKTSKVQHGFTSLMGILILLVNIGAILAMVGLFSGQWKEGLLFLGLKFAVDYVLIRKTARLWEQSFSAFDYIKSAITYPFFITFTGVYSLFSGYHWKGEQYTK